MREARYHPKRGIWVGGGLGNEGKRECLVSVREGDERMGTKGMSPGKDEVDPGYEQPPTSRESCDV